LTCSDMPCSPGSWLPGPGMPDLQAISPGCVAVVEHDVGLGQLIALKGRTARGNRLQWSLQGQILTQNLCGVANKETELLAPANLAHATLSRGFASMQRRRRHPKTAASPPYTSSDCEVGRYTPCLERVAEQAPTAASTSDANCATTAARAKGVLSRNLMRSWAKGPLPSPFMQQGNGPDTAAKPALAAGSCLQRNLQ